MIGPIKQTMALLHLFDSQPFCVSSDESEQASVSSLLVQTPTNHFPDNILSPDLLRWCVARQAPRHAFLVPCHTHCRPAAKIVASSFPIYVPSLTNHRNCQALNLPIEPHRLILTGRKQIPTQTDFVCSSPTALSSCEGDGVESDGSFRRQVQKRTRHRLKRRES
ncbi:hypothetical protein BLNAU_5183 [Blattamonas nauphoetae]|uniref:Uncharacterized protein n=1 Tax=Blattamonas nauphoetae TaxID=2049346 RepID=A0ABQ9Y8B3_9EUKA|nr:hypothetical protein BLNAU_5183 [Blattamonas nauphoetae]